MQKWRTAKAGAPARRASAAEPERAPLAWVTLLCASLLGASLLVLIVALWQRHRRRPDGPNRRDGP